MSLVINNNMMAANVARNLNTHYSKLAQSTQRLSTGMRINSAADDAAGLAIRELQRADIAALHQGARNANDAISLIQVADGSLGIIDEKLIRMKELAEQAATGSYDSTQRMMIESEYQAMASEITRIANATDFNGIHLLNGNLQGKHDGTGLNAKGRLKVHFGTGNDAAEDYYYIEIGTATAAAFGLGNAAFTDPTVELTTEYYEKLRDQSAQGAYDYTYKLKYADYYEKIYNKLKSGTPVSEPMDASTASAQADSIAKTLAANFAEEDRQMVVAAMDKIYNDNYMAPYLAAYQENLASGMSAAAAHAAADKTAAAIALKAVYNTNKNVVSANSATPYIEDDVEALPPKNSKGAQALLDEGWTLVYDASYKRIYDDMYTDAVTKAMADTTIVGIDPDQNTLTPASGVLLTTAQILAIHEAVDAAASAQATSVADKAKANLTTIYDTVYGDNTAGTNFRIFYDQALDDGYPAEVAEKIAEEQASALAWDTLEAALRNGTYTLDDSDFDVSTEISVPTTLPTWNQIDTLLSTTQTAVYNQVYDKVVDDVYYKIFDIADDDPSIIPTSPHEPTATQRDQMLAVAQTEANRIATEVSEQIKNAVYAVYQHAYDPPSSTEKDAWIAVQTALADAIDGTPFGISDNSPNRDSDTDDGLTGHYLAESQFAYNLTEMTINTAEDLSTTTLDLTGVNNDDPATDVTNAYIAAHDAAIAWMNTHLSDTTNYTPITAENEGDASPDSSVASDAQFVIDTVKTTVATWLDTLHALNGSDPALVEACKDFIEQYLEDITPSLMPGGTISTQAAAQEAIVAINNAIVSKDKIRAHLGALQNRLENTITNLNTQAENLQAAESRISDVDVATEMTEFVRQQILAQSAVAMLAQANSLPQMAMQLIGG